MAEARIIVSRGPLTLWRCGHSKNKPLCDAIHRTIEWDGSPRTWE
jgi:CDGSH-type Zn-finger protein